MSHICDKPFPKVWQSFKKRLRPSFNVWNRLVFLILYGLGEILFRIKYVPLEQTWAVGNRFVLKYFFCSLEQMWNRFNLFPDLFQNGVLSLGSNMHTFQNLFHTLKLGLRWCGHRRTIAIVLLTRISVSLGAFFPFTHPRNLWAISLFLFGRELFCFHPSFHRIYYCQRARLPLLSTNALFDDWIPLFCPTNACTINDLLQVDDNGTNKLFGGIGSSWGGSSSENIA